MSTHCIQIGHVARAALFCVIFVTIPLVETAQAQFHVEHPEVYQGEIEAEYFGSYYSGLPRPPAEAPRHGHAFELSYGLTHWWSLTVAAEAEKERNEEGGFNAFKLSEIELETVLELLPLEGDGLAFSLFAKYGESLVNGVDESEIAFGPIVKAVKGATSITGNLFPVYAFDLQETKIEDGEIEIERETNHWNLDYAWQLKHQATDMIAFGVEGFGGFADLGGDLPGTQAERHRLGPVLYVTLGEGGDHRPGHSDHAAHAESGPEIELAIGALIGLNDDTSDLTLKWDAEIEF
jgi:hypothetical protein